MTRENNLLLLNQVLELINNRKLDEAFELYDSDYVYHGPGNQELRGRSSIRGLWDLFLSAFPDLVSSVEDTICEEDKVVLRWKVTGTHTGEFLGIAATHRTVTLPITEVFRIENGKLKEAWDQYDRLYLMEQLGKV